MSKTSPSFPDAIFDWPRCAATRARGRRRRWEKKRAGTARIQTIRKKLSIQAILNLLCLSFESVATCTFFLPRARCLPRRVSVPKNGAYICDPDAVHVGPARECGGAAHVRRCCRRRRDHSLRAADCLQRQRLCLGLHSPCGVARSGAGVLRAVYQQPAGHSHVHAVRLLVRPCCHTDSGRGPGSSYISRVSSGCRCHRCSAYANQGCCSSETVMSCVPPSPLRR